jgi:multicomponent Na+:H+ antiporter subunit F
MLMNLLLIPMMLILLVPFYTAWRETDIWQKMLALASICTKVAILVLFISVLRNDWMIGVVAVIILSVGNAGYMLLAQILKRINDVAPL